MNNKQQTIFSLYSLITLRVVEFASVTLDVDGVPHDGCLLTLNLNHGSIPVKVHYRPAGTLEMDEYDMIPLKAHDGVNSQIDTEALVLQDYFELPIICDLEHFERRGIYHLFVPGIDMTAAKAFPEFFVTVMQRTK